MKLEVIADVIQELYYSGRVRVYRKLDARDFLQLARAAAGSITRKLYYEERQLDQQYWFFSKQIVPKIFELSAKDKRNRRTITIRTEEESEALRGYMRLPNGLGIFEIRPEEIVDGVERIGRAEVGSESLYTGKAYEDVPFWIEKGDKVYFFNLPDCVKKVEVDGIPDDDDMDISEDIAFDVINAVLGISLKTIGFPVDKTDNNNPNVVDVKHRLAEAAGV